MEAIPMVYFLTYLKDAYIAIAGLQFFMVTQWNPHGVSECENACPSSCAFSSHRL